MAVLVAYATKHGSTQEIAERIAAILGDAGLVAEAKPVREVTDLTLYDAFVIGGAVYIGSWLKPLKDFLNRNHEMLARKPVWLFSSGPLGTSPSDDEGHDIREAAVPKELASVSDLIKPREHRVFFGAFDHTRADLGERLLYALPAGRRLLKEGDFRNWAEIEAWAHGIAEQLAPAATR